MSSSSVDFNVESFAGILLTLCGLEKIQNRSKNCGPNSCVLNSSKIYVVQRKTIKSPKLP